jgi:hypothetical protein
MMLAVVQTLLLAALVSCNMAYYEPPLLEALAVPAADHETTSYLLPRLSAKFRPHGDWESAPDPRFYLLTELERESNQVTAETSRNTRSSMSLGVVIGFKEVGSESHISINLRFLSPISQLNMMCVYVCKYIEDYRQDKFSDTTKFR